MLEPGEFRIDVGALLPRHPAQPGHPGQRATAAPVLSGLATLEEWLADADGGPALRAAIGPARMAARGASSGTRNYSKIIGNFPLSALAAFPGLGVTHDMVRTLAGGGPADG